MASDSRKKLNTFLFVVLATIMNLFLMVLFIVIGLVLLAKFGNLDNPDANMVWLMVIFISSIAIATVIYNRVFKIFAKKHDLEKTFAPLLGGGRNRKLYVDDDDLSSGLKR